MSARENSGLREASYCAIASLDDGSRIRIPATPDCLVSLFEVYGLN